ncbi:glycosyltransferase family 8 protein [Agaribacter flavus]|uniref:Glycosyltransferase family 8 protein n=1 Tax=Agaribacter flavus TaxID=1902781 RepID=A0ABV7FN30_9ALTE
MRQHSRIQIAFCLDDNYVQQVDAVIRSIAATNANNAIDIHLVFNDLSIRNQSYFEQHQSENLSIHFVSTDILVDDVGPKNHVSKATFVKFEIIKAIDGLDKILYLDGDIIVLDDLLPLWETDISDYCLGAVENPFSSRHEALNMHSDAVYFNAGVLLMNLKMMRQTGFYARAHEYINKQGQHLIFHDQDVFNHLVNGCFYQMDAIYNYQTFFIRKIHLFDKVEQRTLREALDKAVIMHYSSGIKPWFYLDPHPRAKLFRRYYTGALRRDVSESLLRQVVRYLVVKAYYFTHKII